MAVITYHAPGVYLEEVPSGDRPIQAVGTSTAGFVGSAPNPNCATDKPVVVNSWAEFVRRFMSLDPTNKEDRDLLGEVEDKRTALDKAVKKVSVPEAGSTSEDRNKAKEAVKTARAELSTALNNLQYPSTDLSNAVYGFFLNGGTRCWIVNVGPMKEKIENGKKVKVKPAISAGARSKPVGLDLLEAVDEVAIVAAPGYTDAASYAAIRDHCDKLRDRVGILDGPSDLDDDAMTLLGGDNFGNNDWTKPYPSEYGQLALYVPWIGIPDPDVTVSSNGTNGSKPAIKWVPPSGHVAGVWARSDATRGVHKAPANEPLRGVLGLQRQLTQEEQGPLNQKGVNVLRYFTNEGYMVWGARTLTLDTSFNYLNVRRLFNMIEESIVESTRWIVFEPNDRPLWQAIRRDVTAFLMGFWRDGALMGRTPQEAFFVKCDEENNPMDSIRQGRVVIEVGLAPVYPAEFVIFKISQYQAKTEVEVQPA